ncbi:uracil-DNA glycosylase [Frigidibacter sp. ROC022]|uniref:uracil-DNA glycosylase n=1 Tax=Frigidibacter sp. ROC022 TaxID=2971796 RepID=UPI00215B320F|nr:uracil-DNA glycosylase [Frigidibacter sp. ROC022]MCR8726603.1 uracil-DNA glycosylase [Frigidibacter sp. ROC022]
MLDSPDDQEFHALKAALDWQVEMGATDAISDAPIDRYAAPPPPPKPQPAAAPAGRMPPAPGPDPVAEARAAAEAATTLDALRAAMAAYDHCELKRGARQLVFADGNPSARVMIVGEAPGREEDRAGRPFVGQAGQLLDRMLAAINLARTSEDPAGAVYITNVLPWRPPENRDPSPEEIAMLKPFLERHVALVNPELLVVMGNHACMALLGKRGITRLRGQWDEALGRPALPMFHPAYLLRSPHEKRATWADLLALQARLRQS